MLDAELAKYLMNPSERVMHDRKRLFVCSSVITVVLSINYRDATHTAINTRRHYIFITLTYGVVTFLNKIVCYYY